MSDSPTYLSGPDVVECIMACMAATYDDPHQVFGHVYVQLVAEGDVTALRIMSTTNTLAVVHVFTEFMPQSRDALMLDLPVNGLGVMLAVDKVLHRPALKSVLRRVRAKKRPQKHQVEWSLTERGLRVIDDDLDVGIQPWVKRWKDDDGTEKSDPTYPDLHSTIQDRSREPSAAEAVCVPEWMLADLPGVLGSDGEMGPIRLRPIGPKMIVAEPMSGRTGWGSRATALLCGLG
jgi:hypothetical protein